MANKPKKLGAPPSDQDAANEYVEKYLKLLRDYQNVVFAVLMLVLVVGVLAVWQHQRSEEQEAAAWTELGKVREHDAEKLKPILEKYEGTDAHPFLVLAYAGKLYERGEKADLENAKKMLERARDEVRGNEIMSGLVKDQLVGIQKELDDTKLWTGTAPVNTGTK